MTIQLQATNIHKRFGDREVLKGISFSAKAGDVVTLIGSSGSGKSTFLRCLNLLEQPHEGEMSLGGEALKLVRDRDGSLKAADAHQLQRWRARLAMVFQNFNLWAHMTVLENVIEAPIHVLGKPKAEAIERAQALLARVGVSHRAHVYPAQLSGGEQQRVAVAVALSNLPMILLADEPTAELDSASAALVLDAFQSVNHEFGVTIVMVTHDLLAAKRAHRQLRLRDGQLLVEGRPMEPLGTDGRARLPDEAIDALSGVDLEVEVRDGEVRIRRRGEGGLGGE
jgi:arginine/ornithine transport system ATP-binding protein